MEKWKKSGQYVMIYENGDLYDGVGNMENETDKAH